MRSLFTIALVGTLLLGFFEAPFNHVHEHGSGTDHHTVEAAHVHLPQYHAPSHGAAIQQLDPADDERLITWFETTEQSPFLLYIAPRTSRLPEPMALNEFLRPAPMVCNHDPPFDPARPSRAPPPAFV